MTNRNGAPGWPTAGSHLLHSSFVIRHSSFVILILIRHSSFVIRHSSFRLSPSPHTRKTPVLRNTTQMKKLADRAGESGKLGWIFLWLLGVPIPVLIILYLLRGCT